MPRKNKKSIGINELAKTVSRDANISQEQARQIIELYFKEIRFNITEGKKVVIPKFVRFEITKWKTNIIYDINTGKKVTRDLRTIAFKASGALKKKVN